MGKFEEPKSRGAELPSDLPKAAEAAREHPDGSIYNSDNGKRYRLKHASWSEVTPRDKTKKTATKK